MVASMMNSLFVALFALVASSFRARAALQVEILALRHQLAVLHKNGPRRLRLKPSERWLWVLLSRFWSGWRPCLQMVQPDTVIRWHRRAFAWYWTRKSRRRQVRSAGAAPRFPCPRSEEHTSELQSHLKIVCRLLLRKKTDALR